MWNRCALLLMALVPLLAAEKSHDWKTGRIAESKAGAGPQIHTVTSAGKNYLVRGSLGNDESLAVGAEVRFALEGKIMFISVDSREYRLSLVGETLATHGDAEAPKPEPVPAAAPRLDPPRAELPIPPPAAVKSAESTEALDNDAIVKMVVGGLKPDTVIRVIEARSGKYILTQEARGALKAAGVPPDVIAAMSSKMKH